MHGRALLFVFLFAVAGSSRGLAESCVNQPCQDGDASRVLGGGGNGTFLPPVDSAPKPENEGSGKESTEKTATSDPDASGGGARSSPLPRPDDTPLTFGNPDDTPLVRAAKLEEAGHDRFYRGVQQVAIGISLVAQAEQDRKAGEPKAQVDADRSDGIKRIAKGNRDIDVGRDLVKHANVIQDREARMQTGGASGASPAPFQFNEAHAPEATLEALATMKEAAGVAPQSLIDAVNHGGAGAVLDLAAGTNGLELSQAQIAAAVPSFATSSAPSAAAPAGGGMPSVPAWSGPAKPDAKGETRTVASAAPAAKPPREARAREETLQPLTSDQLIGSIQPRGTSLGSDEFGDPGTDLFGRVRGQYFKRRSDLRLTARAAR